MALQLSLSGSQYVIRNIQQLPKRLKRRAFRIALDAAGGVIRDEVKKQAPRETGLLRRSMGVKTTVPNNTMKARVMVGPKRGFKQPIEKSNRGKLKVVSTKVQKLLPTSGNAIYRNPTRYAHLVEGGTKNGAKAQRYMRRALSAKGPAAVQKMEDKLRTALGDYYVPAGGVKING